MDLVLAGNVDGAIALMDRHIEHVSGDWVQGIAGTGPSGGHITPVRRRS